MTKSAWWLLYRAPLCGAALAPLALAVGVYGRGLGATIDAFVLIPEIYCESGLIMSATEAATPAERVFIDSHCHFDFDEFSHDREQVFANCRERGVNEIVVPGIKPAQWFALAELCETFDGLHMAAGVHPWWVERVVSESVSALAQLEQSLVDFVAQNKVVAIGECGLDAAIATPMSLQLAVLRLQLQVASQKCLPVILHSRKTHGLLLQELKDTAVAKGGVVHGFSGSYEQACAFWDLGIRIGVGGTITYPRAAKTRAAVTKMPLEALLLETDAPDMPLAGRQGQRNSPEYLPEVAQVLADLRLESVETIAARTSANAADVFGL